MDLEYLSRWLAGGLISVLFIVLGLVLFLSKIGINNYIGYRSRLSMLNDYTWRYANRACSVILLIGGAVLAAEVLALNLARAHYVVFLSVFCPTLLLVLIISAVVPQILLKRLLSDKDKSEQKKTE